MHLAPSSNECKKSINHGVVISRESIVRCVWCVFLKISIITRIYVKVVIVYWSGVCV